MIYFDNSATTKVHPMVLDTYVKTTQRIMGNPSSLHNLGGQAERLISQSRKQIADILEVKSAEIYFTSGGTEGNNWIIKGTAIEKQPFGNHMIISAIEHSAVVETTKQLEQLGFEVSIAPVNDKGFVEVEKLKELIRPETILVSIMAVNNEIGTIQPINEISEILQKYPNIHFHVDAVQAVGKVNKSQWLTDRVDFATFSAHKFHGPKGTGFIYWREGKKIAPLINGGGQEKNQRSGTENVPGIVAMSKAFRLQMTDEKAKQAHEENIKRFLVDSLSKFEKVTIFSHVEENYAPHILCFALKGVRGEVLVHAFEQKEIYISTTSACSSKKNKSGGTLKGMRVPEHIASTAVRVSLDEMNTMVEAEQFMIVFNQLYQNFLKINN